jgi:hypothetical protein
MTYEEYSAARSLIRFHDLIKELQNEVSQLRGLHWGTLTAAQKQMVIVATVFSYADAVSEQQTGAAVHRTGDGTFWAFEKCLK